MGDLKCVNPMVLSKTIVHGKIFIFNTIIYTYKLNDLNLLNHASTVEISIRLATRSGDKLIKSSEIIDILKCTFIFSHY